MSTYLEQAKTVAGFVETLSREHPKAAEGFLTLHKSSAGDSALTGRQKELIALGISIAIRCEGCISCHVKAALKAGATQEEIVETIGVSILMGGGPSVVYGEKAYQAMKEMM
ncbi:carboxymuconolactone decarboxylase family protein [Phaeodactylibacter xiamenensis]|uniref:carboxymuconolactone decarboxylase family protein n=1 Tax=Phaeodactylibacter xiamenensis TaxID=1524460 RepID=UPI003BAC47DC